MKARRPVYQSLLLTAAWIIGGLVVAFLVIAIFFGLILLCRCLNITFDDAAITVCVLLIFGAIFHMVHYKDE